MTALRDPLARLTGGTENPFGASAAGTIPTADYSPDQPRDDHGRWSNEGGNTEYSSRQDYTKSEENAIITEKLRVAAKLPKAAVIHLNPTPVNVDSLTFDDTHINQERSHHVSEEQAKQYIRDAKISVTVWNGQFERYYGADGSTYVNMVKNEIRTTYSRDQYDENTTALIEEMKKIGILG